MQSMNRYLQQRWPSQVLSLTLLVGILLTDSLTQADFGHGLLYCPVLLLAALSQSKRFLMGVFWGSFALIWLGLFLTIHFNADAFSAILILNRLLACLVLIILYILCLRNLYRQQQHSAAQQQLQLTADLVRVGGWQLRDQTVTLSPAAKEILSVSTSQLSLSAFAGLFLESDAKQLCQHIQQQSLPMAQSVRQHRSNGGIKWLRIVASAEAHRHVTGVIQDIHASQLQEARSQEEERRLRFIADSMQMFIWSAWPDGRLDYVSRYTVDYTGEDESEILPNWLSFLHPDDQEPTRLRWQQSIQTGEPYTMEFRIRRHDGEYNWFLTKAMPARDEMGEIFKWYGSGIDIGESKQLQQHSETLSRQLQSTLSSITDAFFTLDKAMCFSYANQQACSLLGKTQSTLLNRCHINQTSLDDDGAFSIQLERGLLSRKMMTFEFWYAERHSWLDVRVYPAEAGLTVYLRDITRQRSAQEELKLLRSAVSQLNDIVIITDAAPIDEPGPRIVFVNDAFERLTGYRRDEVIGKSPRFLQGPKTQRGELDKIRRALLTKQPVRTKLTNYHKSGHEIEMELSIVPITIDAGRISHIVSVQREISGELNLQKQLQLAQRMEAVGQLTGGIAHDFNNLLTVISGNNALLAESIQQPNLLALTKLIGDAAERGARLTGNLLAFARRQPLLPTQVDINELIEKMHELLLSSLGQHISLKLDLTADLWPVSLDPVQMESCLLNLIINSRDAMPEGGHITIQSQNCNADEQADDTELRGQEWVVISVLDSGGGISAEIIDKIFEPFFTTKAKGKGSGLGLSMIFGFIKQSGGHIRVQSEATTGTCFRLYLPPSDEASDDEDQQAITDEALLDKISTADKTILVVDDDDLVRQYAVSQLHAAGYRVLSTNSAEKALTWLQSTQAIDLLFTDVLMPDSFSGTLLAQKVQQCRPNLPVLFTSGFTENALDEVSAPLLQQHLLRKPYDRATLLQRIAQLLADSEGT
ncbi:putative sensor histidine kinase with a response regulator receiver domain [Methylophaga frappieri]|uniref:histidine kinase n=1 Tax=Methylophaga frappieri (strain ATCC BAA-2434 / DSM 25690 / JAM7) TaxID=754477 RepID=I1YJW5_METFJ|nr:hybrid sensor histidine kinase/response regulator [Methylophaga frappieri]AFJ03208.1 putative sensor histidine kinase with a response regulator receiver domain [Methylophaga frappieri]